jgi:hypothetical protein
VWQPPVTRLWAVYSNPDKLCWGAMPNRDPFDAAGFPMGDWLIRRRDQIVARRDFNGVTVFLVDVTGDVYNTNEFGGE